MKLIITVTIILCSYALFAQNIVTNPDFEDYNTLPDSWDQWNRCNNWLNPASVPSSSFYGNPDYFHLNGSGPVQLPGVPPAYVQAYSGDAIMGILTYHASSTDARDYLMNPLTSPMVVGGYYEVIMQVSNGESNHGYVYGTDNLGVHFSVDPIPTQTSFTNINRTPQAFVDSVLWVDEWTEVKFIIQADSAYEYLTIGNFFPDSQTNAQLILTGPLPFQGAYYFLDSIVVNRIDVSDVNELKFQELNIFPNPTTEELQIDLGEGYDGALRVSLIDGQGRTVLSESIEMKSQHSIKLEVADFARGNYTLIVNAGEQQLSRKVSLR